MRWDRRHRLRLSFEGKRASRVSSGLTRVRLAEVTAPVRTSTVSAVREYPLARFIYCGPESYVIKYPLSGAKERCSRGLIDVM